MKTSALQPINCSAKWLTVVSLPEMRTCGLLSGSKETKLVKSLNWKHFFLPFSEKDENKNKQELFNVVIAMPPSLR